MSATSGARPAWTRRAAALATALAGLVTVVSSLSPALAARASALARLEPAPAQAAAHVAGVAGGLALVWLAGGVLDGRRSTSRAAVGVLAVLAFVHLAKGLDYEEAVLGLAVAAALQRLALGRHARDGASAVTLCGLVLLAAVLAAYAVALSVLLVSGRSPHLAATLWSAAGAAAGAAPGAVGGSWRTVLHVLSALAAGALVVLARMLLRPVQARTGHPPAEHERAARLVALHGDDSIAPFALRADKAFHFAGGAVVAYRTLRETAVVAGDPIGPRGARRAAMATFLTFARSRGWDVVLLGAAPERLGDYAALGLHALQVGLEAVVNPGAFALAAPAAKGVRKAVRRVERRGWTVEVLEQRAMTPQAVAAVAAVERAWRRGRPRLQGFAMASDRLWGAPEDGHDVYALARDPHGEVRAFQRYVRYRRGLSLDAMRRLDDDPNGISESLVAAVLDHARQDGCEEVSLNFAGFGHLMAADALERRTHRVARWVLRRLHGRFQLERLARFAGNFGPEWRPRYLVYTGRTRLPLAALRVLQAEAYLPPPPTPPRAGSWLPAPEPVTVAP